MRKTRKRLVGRQEDTDRRERETEYAQLTRVLHREWRCGVQQLCPLAQRERERARREFLALDVFAHHEE